MDISVPTGVATSDLSTGIPEQGTGNSTKLGSKMKTMAPIDNDALMEITVNSLPIGIKKPTEAELKVADSIDLDTTRESKVLEAAAVQLDVVKTMSSDDSIIPKVEELKKTVEVAAIVVKDLKETELKAEVAAVQVEVAVEEKQKKQKKLESAMKDVQTAQTPTSVKKLEEAKEAFDAAKKHEEVKVKELVQETNHKDAVKVEAVKLVKKVEMKKEQILKSAPSETKEMIRKIDTPSTKVAAAEQMIYPTTSSDGPSVPEVIVKKDCDFLKHANLVSEFFLDKNDRKCYGMASTTINGSKHLVAVQCDATPSGVCPSELSMDHCRVSSLTASKLADIF